MRYPDIPLPLPASGFILSQHLSDSDPLLAVSRFDTQQYDDALGIAWDLPLPARFQRAVKRRRAEYLASRLLAREVMARLGQHNFILTNAADRSPVWPMGIQASLSHSEGIIVLAASQKDWCLGVDVEQQMADDTARETAKIMMQPQEQDYLNSLPLSFSLAATLLFSLKESLYKALWPRLHQPMDFHQAALIAVDTEKQRATLRLEHSFSDEFQQGMTLQAQFMLQPRQVITLLSHPYADKSMR